MNSLRSVPEPPMQQPSQAEQAWLALEERIVTLDLAPGARVTEGELIALTGLGRTPVREAIQRLAWEGFLEIRPRAGIVVAPLDPSDWPKVISARHGVEVLLAREAATRLAPDAARAFEGAAEAMRAAARDGDMRAFLAADKAFDLALASTAENAYAVRLAAPLQTHSRRFWYASATESGLQAAARSHLALIETILARAPEKAAEAADALMNALAELARTQ